MVVFGERLDTMILKVFHNLNDSMIQCSVQGLKLLVGFIEHLVFQVIGCNLREMVVVSEFLLALSYALFMCT